MGPSPKITNVLIKMGKDRDTVRTPHDDRSRDWLHAATRQGMPRIDSYHQKLYRGKKGFYSVYHREHRPVTS